MTVITTRRGAPAIAAALLVSAFALSACAPGAPATKPATVESTATGAPSSATATRTSAPPRPTPPSGALAFGQAATFGDLRITVVGTSVGPQWEGRPTSVFSVTFENRGTGPVAYDESDWSVVTTKGTSSTKKAVLDQKSLGSGMLAAGDKLTGQIQFSCPGALAQIVYRPDTSGAKPAVWMTR
jgi:hypothetical protein